MKGFKGIYISRMSLDLTTVVANENENELRTNGCREQTSSHALDVQNYRDHMTLEPGQMQFSPQPHNPPHRFFLHLQADYLGYHSAPSRVAIYLT